MPNLVPVDHDPFAQPQGGGQPNLVPVEHDPFAEPQSQGDQPWYQKLGSAADDIVRLAADGMTFGYADRLAGYMNGQGTATEQAKTDAARERSGILAPVVELGGSVASGSGLANAGLTAGRLVPKAMNGVGGYLARTAAMGADGAALGALSATGHNEDPVMGAIYGGAAGTAGKLAGDAISSGIGKVAGKFSKQPPLMTKDEIRAAADDLYTRSDKAGVIIKPEGLQRLAGEIEQSLAEGGYHPQLQAKVGVALEELNRIAQGNATLKGVDVLRRMANAAKTDADPSTRKFGGEFVDKIDDFLGDLKAGDVLAGNRTEGVRTLQEARRLWASLRKSDMIDDAVQRADLQAASAGSGGNIDNALRQQFKAILNNRKKSRSLTPDERVAMQLIVKGTTGQNLARLVGKLSPQGNGLMLYLQAIGGIASGGATAPLAVVGGAAKFAADRATPGNVDRLSRIVRAGGNASDAFAPPNALERLAEAKRDALGRTLMTGGILAASP